VGSLYVDIMSQTFNYFNGLTWDNVVWSDSYERVRRIQKRIFKASKSSDKKRMWFLQKLLITNPHAKLVAVHMVTNSLEQSSSTPNQEKILIKPSNNSRIEEKRLKEFSSEEKLLIARYLKITGKVNIKTVFSSLAFRDKGSNQFASSKPGKKVKNIVLPFPIPFPYGDGGRTNPYWISSGPVVPSSSKGTTGPRTKELLEKEFFNISTIQDRAKQILCLLALEPEWEAKLEGNVYGFRPSRSVQEVIEGLSFNLNSFEQNEDKFVFNADIRKCFSKIDYEAFLLKLDTFPLMKKQIGAWLKAGLLDLYAENFKQLFPSFTHRETKGEKLKEKNENLILEELISNLLVNILLYGLESHLLSYLSNLTNCPIIFPESEYGISPSNYVLDERSSVLDFSTEGEKHDSQQQGKTKVSKRYIQSAENYEGKKAALSIVKYAGNFIFIHKNLDILKLVAQEMESWLSKAGLTIFQHQDNFKLVSQGFEFLGFQIAYIRVQGKFQVKITPSKQSVLQIIHKTRTIIQSNKAASAYELICKLKPVLIGWANYFQFCDCKPTFSKIDNLVYQQLRAWVFRRAVRQGREIVKEKYFPSGKQYKFQGHIYTGNWILNGTKKFNNNTVKTIFLPKISWIKS
jgi:retron-type reverse transcriptase